MINKDIFGSINGGNLPSDLPDLPEKLIEFLKKLESAVGAHKLIACGPPQTNDSPVSMYHKIVDHLWNVCKGDIVEFKNAFQDFLLVEDQNAMVEALKEEGAPLGEIVVLKSKIKALLIKKLMKGKTYDGLLALWVVGSIYMDMQRAALEVVRKHRKKKEEEKKDKPKEGCSYSDSEEPFSRN